MNTWAAIQHLRETDPDMTDRRLREIAHIQGLDLPHTPGIQHVISVSGSSCWQVYCLGCTHQYGSMARTCRFGIWEAPGMLVDAEPMLTRLAAALDDRPEEADGELEHFDLAG